MKLLASFILLLTLSLTTTAQVVNVERMRLDQKKRGWSGSVTGNFDVRRNQRTVVTLGSKAHVQHAQDSNTVLLVAQAGLVKASGADFVNFAFTHLRYTHYVTDFLSLEAFTQLQQNRVNGIQSRWLIGAGVRGRVIDDKAATLYTGLLVMREREREVVDSIPTHRDIRLSSYLAGSYTPESADWITVATTTYFQPRVGKFRDIRISSDWNLQFRIRDNLALTSTLNIVYDARPPVGLDKTVYSVLNGLKFTFG